MASYFLDTSAFAKIYHEEAGSEYLERLLQMPSSIAVVSRLAMVEIESVIAIKVRTGVLDLAGQALFRRRLRADLFQKRIRIGPPIEDRHYDRARRLLVRYGTEMALRTLDALQLAIALDLRRLGLISVLVAADQRLCRVAVVCGCPAIDTGDPGLTLL